MIFPSINVLHFDYFMKAIETDSKRSQLISVTGVEYANNAMGKLDL